MSSYGVSKGVQGRPFVYTTHVLLRRVKTITNYRHGTSDSLSPSIEGRFIYKQTIFINAIAFMSSLYLVRTKAIFAQVS